MGQLTAVKVRASKAAWELPGWRRPDAGCKTLRRLSRHRSISAGAASGSKKNSPPGRNTRRQPARPSQLLLKTHRLAAFNRTDAGRSRDRDRLAAGRKHVPRSPRSGSLIGPCFFRPHPRTPPAEPLKARKKCGDGLCSWFRNYN